MMKTRPFLLVLGALVVYGSATDLAWGYSGGAGTAANPYKIANVNDLVQLGSTPADAGKHFVLTADIDLNPTLPGRKVYAKAVIAPMTDPNDPWSEPQGTPFSGVFNGNSHTISHLTIVGGGYLGLFGKLAEGAQVKNLAVVDVNIVSTREGAGGLAGSNWGSIDGCYTTGTIAATGYEVGGLVGWNLGALSDCYSTVAITGTAQYTGGLVGYNAGPVTRCYSAGVVSGKSPSGGLIGSGYASHIVMHGVWDVETSGLSHSAGGVGLTTAQMKDPNALGLNGFANDPNWVLNAGLDYPRLAWQRTRGSIIRYPVIDWMQGHGTPNNPYRIETRDQLILLCGASLLWDKHVVLSADVNLAPEVAGGKVFVGAPIHAWVGVFDGNDHVISNLEIEGDDYLGLFGILTAGGVIKDVHLENVDVNGIGDLVGGLVANNRGGLISDCHTTGSVKGSVNCGGLVGRNHQGTVSRCYCACAVDSSGTYYSFAGGVAGDNQDGTLANCYSTGAVAGKGRYVGGLVGHNRKKYRQESTILNCYSTGRVSGGILVGGLVGYSEGTVSTSFWDTLTSQQAASSGGTGLTTSQMKGMSTYLTAGWDLVGETINGTEDIWKMPKAGGYPLLSWQPGAAAMAPGFEGFETGDFSAFTWQLSGNSHWFVTSSDKHLGSYSARAGHIGNNQTSTLKVTGNYPAGKISFYVKTSCESFDKLLFRVDGATMGSWTGIGDWTAVSHSVAAGNRTFEWTYSKDSSFTKGEDTVWLDSITFP